MSREPELERKLTNYIKFAPLVRRTESGRALITGEGLRQNFRQSARAHDVRLAR